MSEKEHSQKLPTRKKLHVAFIALFPVLFQIMTFFLIADWAEGAGSGKGMMGLFAFIMILFAIPVSIVVNILIATYSPKINFIWILMLAIFIALVLPILGGLSILLAP